MLIILETLGFTSVQGNAMLERAPEPDPPVNVEMSFY